MMYQDRSMGSQGDVDFAWGDFWAEQELRSLPTAAGEEILEGTVTIVFTDVVASTELALRVGDYRYADAMAGLAERLEAVVAEHGGHPLQRLGDGLLVVFGSARRALRASRAMQEEFARTADEFEEFGVDTMRLRVAAHTGEVLQRDTDLAGVHINIAARVLDHAGPGEIVVTSVTRDVTEGSPEFEFEPGPTVELKGLDRVHELHRLLWRAADLLARQVESGVHVSR
jgi:class 3 adenylate cyclase